MSARHQLSLEFPETTNRGIFRIEDTSIYTSILPVQCASLEITPPGFGTPTVISDLTQGFNLILNACQVGTLSTGCDSVCPDLPDGLWHIRYSVAPNDKVYVEYDYLRIVNLMQHWYKTLCWVNSRPADPTIETLTLIKELQLIESNIKAAQYLVGDIHDQATGIEMFQYASKKLSDISQGCRTC